MDLFPFLHQPFSQPCAKVEKIVNMGFICGDQCLDCRYWDWLHDLAVCRDTENSYCMQAQPSSPKITSTGTDEKKSASETREKSA